MRRPLAWLACAIGLAWLLRRLRLRKPASAPTDDPAEELRRKLAETRPAGSEEPEPEPPAPPPAPGVDERRRAVHERARAAIDDMQGATPDPE